MNTYTLSYNPLENRFSQAQLATFVKESRKVFQWYSPFMGTYVLKSEEPLTSLTESFRGFFDGAPFLLTACYPTFTGGAQPPNVWEWLNTGFIPSITQKN